MSEGKEREREREKATCTSRWIIKTAQSIFHKIEFKTGQSLGNEK